MIDQPTLVAIRFGYGLPLVKGAPTTPDALLKALAGPDQMAQTHTTLGFSDILPQLARTQKARQMMRQGDGEREAYRLAVRESAFLAETEARCGFARALDAPDGFRERLVAFWADHFTTRARSAPERPLPGTLTHDAIRPNLTGPFADLLVAATLHPAMLSYLDQSASVGPGSAFGRRRGRGVNENLAREVMELHSLGVGAGYAQNDVRQMALLLTGLDANAQDGFIFHPNRAEPGAETVLGKTYGGEGLAPIKAALSDIARREETAAHIARKLAVHFVSDTPDAALVAAMTAAYRDSDGALMQVYRALLTHPAAWEPKLMKARQPVDFLLAALRALGMTGRELRRMGRGPAQRMLARPMALMGQDWQAAPGPDGWPEEAEAWITPQGMAARITWAMEAPGRLVVPMPDPSAFLRRILGTAADERLIWAAARAESKREGVGLVLASPAFNRR
jgi:uncharacterized protein (DUF1800 family)